MLSPVAVDREETTIGENWEGHGQPLLVEEYDVRGLLVDYGTWHAAFGGAMPVDETGVRDAAYGPAGYIAQGHEFTKDQRRALKRSFDYLERAIRQLKENDFRAWLALLVTYLGDPPDPGRVAYWRERKDVWVSARLFVDRHDRAITKLAEYISADMRAREDTADLLVVHPKMLSETEEKATENLNAEIFAVWQRLRVTGLTERSAAEQTASFFTEKGIPTPVDAVERIIEFRDTIKAPICMETGCDREAHSQGLCMRHYQQKRRRDLARAERREKRRDLTK